MSRRLGTLLLALASASCGDSGTEDVPVTGVSVNPGTLTLAFLGETAELTAVVTDANGSTVGASVTWSSSSPAVATVSGSGEVTAVTNGSTTISASADGVSGSATVTVAQRAASVSLTAASDTLDTGASMAIVADVRDSGGTPLAAPALSWSSSDEGVATVDATGVVTGVQKGNATITAGEDGVSGIATLTIVTADLIVTEDLTLTGEVRAGAVVIPAGVTVTVLDDLTLMAEGPVELAGTVQGDCTGLHIESEADVTVTGTLSTFCSQVPADTLLIPGFQMVAANIEIDGATVEISGDGRFDLTGSSAEAVGAVGSAGRAGRIFGLRNSTLRHTPETAAAGANSVESGKRGERGSDFSWILEPEDMLVVENMVIQAQHGGPGGRAENTGTGFNGSVLAFGGPGGFGGRVFLEGGATVEVTGDNTILGGDGGPGGPGIAVAEQSPEDPREAPGAVAKGGAGGWGGLGDFPGVVSGAGGRGGNARATGAAGLSADEIGGPAQEGGLGQADAGSGGKAFNSSGEEVPSLYGHGGDAFATGGAGGEGNTDSPDGAVGGETRTFGGESHADVPGRSGTQTLTGGRGGNGAPLCSAPDAFALAAFLTVLFDPAGSNQFVFNVGGAPLAIAINTLVSVAGRAGNGGAGGRVITGFDGQAGGPPPLVITDAANGGDGGDGGPPPGDGGDPGLDTHGSAQPTTVSNSFQPGDPGSPCAAGTPRPGASAITVGVGQQNAEGDRAVTFDSTNPTWVEVTGLLAADNTFTAEGRGVMAGFPNILVQFAGTYDPESGALTGDYTMDPEKLISAGHPLVYRVAAGN